MSKLAALFDAEGKRLWIIDPAKLVARTTKQWYFWRQFPKAGQYWFVWDCDDKRGSGFYGISVHALRKDSWRRLWKRKLSYTLHSADFPDFDVEAAIKNSPAMPANVEATVRRHVRYREGVKPEPEDQDHRSWFKPARPATLPHGSPS